MASGSGTDFERHALRNLAHAELYTSKQRRGMQCASEGARVRCAALQRLAAALLKMVSRP